MPPAASRSTAAAAGRTKAAASKKNAHVNAKRKSIATDPALLQGSSDEDGEGPPDHEELESTKELPTQGLTSRSTSKISSERTSKAIAGSARADTSTSSPRRSTRLSGEGLGSQHTTSAGSIPRQARNRHDEPSQSEEAIPVRQARVTASNKRKAPLSSSAANATVSTHPTPPETDSDTASRRQPSTSEKSNKGERQSPRIKKLKGISGEPLQPKQRRAPSPPPSDQSDDSDNFAFTRVDPAPSASAPSTSRQIISEAASQNTLPRATAPERTTSTSRNERQTSRAKPATAKKTSSQVSNSADLLQSLKQARQNGTRQQTLSSTLSDAASPKPAEAVIDRKGKRKAEESAGEETDAATALGGPSSQSTTSAQSSRVPAKAKLKKGRVAELSREDLEDAQPLQPPDPGTPGRPISSSTQVLIHTQETPAIQRNLAMRAGLGFGIPPGTPGSARRSSSDMRGRRGSSIGNGFEALPHPSLPSDTLYRHIKADDPPAVRFRTLVTWSAHRLKEASQAQSRTASTEVRTAVSAIMDNLIADLVEKRINLSWQAADPKLDISTAKLPPNPENEANQAKLESCQAWIERLQEEDKARNARINQYKTMTERITKLITPLPLSNTGALGTQSITSDIPDLLQPNWSLSLPRFKDKKDMLEYGQKLLHSKSSGAATRRKSAAAVEIPESNIVNVQDEYPVDYSEMRHQASSLAQNSYRINQFLNLADTYITQHIAKTQMTLSQITRGSSRGSYLAGVGNLTAANSAKGKDGQEGAQSTTRALLEGASGVRSSSNQNRKGGMDAITLLRAISRTETAVESGKKNAAAR